MNTYPTYKDSHIPWIGMIPKHWEIKRIKSLIRSRKSGAWGNEPIGNETDRICLRIADYNYTSCRFRKNTYTIRNYTDEQIKALSVHQGDILIEKSGGGEKTPVGRAVLYDLNLEQPLFANFMEKISLRNFANSTYYVYIFRTFYEKGCTWQYIKQTTGLQNLDINSMFSSELFPLPPISEQQAIANYLTEKTTKIDQYVTLRERERTI